MEPKKKGCGCGKKARKVKMSVPEGKEFNKPYTTDHTYNDHYWDTNRNIDVTVSEGQTYVLPFDKHLDELVNDITKLLKEKNRSYGNSALDPAGIFSKLGATESLCARIDDKLMRIKNKGINDKTEDTVNDLIGYLLLLKMSM
jgi:hypothetical protein|tara:strand:- start:1568 stop:1996 length:429 start_codon:yes stop_codon:yes gene_type:complete